MCSYCSLVAPGATKTLQNHFNQFILWGLGKSENPQKIPMWGLPIPLLNPIEPLTCIPAKGGYMYKMRLKCDKHNAKLTELSKGFL